MPASVVAPTLVNCEISMSPGLCWRLLFQLFHFRDHGNPESIPSTPAVWVLYSGRHRTEGLTPVSLLSTTGEKSLVVRVRHVEAFLNFLGCEGEVTHGVLFGEWALLVLSKSLLTSDVLKKSGSMWDLCCQVHHSFNTLGACLTGRPLCGPQPSKAGCWAWREFPCHAVLSPM